MLHPFFLFLSRLSFCFLIILAPSLLLDLKHLSLYYSSLSISVTKVQLAIWTGRRRDCLKQQAPQKGEKRELTSSLHCQLHKVVTGSEAKRDRQLRQWSELVFISHKSLARPLLQCLAERGGLQAAGSFQQSDGRKHFLHGETSS